MMIPPLTGSGLKTSNAGRCCAPSPAASLADMAPARPASSAAEAGIGCRGGGDQKSWKRVTFSEESVRRKMRRLKRMKTSEGDNNRYLITRQLRSSDRVNNISHDIDFSRSSIISTKVKAITLQERLVNQMDVNEENIQPNVTTTTTTIAGKQFFQSIPIPDDPRRWSRLDVYNWLEQMKNGISTSLDPQRFLMNGKALCLMTADMFTYRVGPDGGRLLYEDFQKRLCQALAIVHHNNYVTSTQAYHL